MDRLALFRRLLTPGGGGNNAGVNPYDRWDVWPFNIGRIRAMRELASELATRNRTLAANLENAASTIEHLRRVEGAYFKAAERIDELEASLQEAIAAQTSALESAGQLTAQNSALTSMNSALTSAINELRRTEAACREAAALAPPLRRRLRALHRGREARRAQH